MIWGSVELVLCSQTWYSLPCQPGGRTVPCCDQTELECSWDCVDVLKSDAASTTLLLQAIRLMSGTHTPMWTRHHW